MSSPAPKWRFNWKGVVGLCLLICIVILAARLIRLRRGPECFPLDGGMASLISIHNGQKYWMAVNTILMQPVAGGPIRAVVQADSRHQLSSVTFEDNALVYQLIPKLKFMGAVGSMGGSRFLGAFRPALHAPTPQEARKEKRVVWRQPKTLPGNEARVYSVSVQGGPPQDITDSLREKGIVVSGEVFWIRKRPDDSAFITSRNLGWMEVTGHSDLVATSLTDGSSRTIRTGLSWSTNLLSGQDGIFWREPHPYPDSQVDLYYYRSKEGRLYKLPDYRGYAFISPVEYQERLYWYVCDIPEYIPNTNFHWEADRLVSANVDGSDLRVLLSPSKIRRLPLTWNNLNSSWREPLQYMKVYRGQIYGLFKEAISANHPDIETPLFLCRIHPERSDPIENVSTLPSQSSNFTIDGDYFYFTRQEENRPFFDQITGDNTHVQRRQMLCRIRMDH